MKTPTLLLVTVLTTAGCGSSSGSDPASPDGGGGGGSDGGGDGDLADAAPAPTHRGRLTVLFEAPAFDGGSLGTDISGGFVAQPDAVCTTTTVDDCEVVSCPKNMHDPLASPGKLRFGPNGFGLSYAWEPGAFPIFFNSNEIGWAAGELVTATGDGDEVPAFSVTAPSPSTLDSGVDGPLFDLPLDRGVPLPVTWNPQSGKVLISVWQQYNEDVEVTIECETAGNLGSFEVPASALASLAPNTEYADTYVRAWGFARARSVAGDYEVELRVLRGYIDQSKNYRVE